MLGQGEEDGHWADDWRQKDNEASARGEAYVPPPGRRGLSFTAGPFVKPRPPRSDEPLSSPPGSTSQCAWQGQLSSAVGKPSLMQQRQKEEEIFGKHWKTDKKDLEEVNFGEPGTTDAKGDTESVFWEPVILKGPHLIPAHIDPMAK